MYPALPIQRPAGRAATSCCPPGRDLGGAAEPGLIGSGITWYDVLGVLPGAGAGKITREYDAKAALLRPDLVSDAPPHVLTAVLRAQELLDTARAVLADPDSRRRYDQTAGLRRSGGGLGQPGTGIGPGIAGELPGTDGAGGLPGRTGWPGPRRRRNRPGAVPDVCGLFYHVCLEVAIRRGLHLRIVRLTEHPMAVDGLVVDQDPQPPSGAGQGGNLTVQLWHPSARPRR